MFGSVLSAAFYGIDCVPVSVEADIRNGLPMFNMVGYLSSQVKEAAERVRIALQNSGFELPPRRITVNLSPADIRKDGTGFDLPIAAAIMASMGCIKNSIEGILFAGELGLDGNIHGIKGILPITETAGQLKCRLCVIPKENEAEAKILGNTPVLAVSSLREMVEVLDGETDLAAEEPDMKAFVQIRKEKSIDFSDIRGQEGAKRAAVIAVSGFHNLLLIGAKGAGKTMLARCIPTLLPDLSREESLEISKIYSIAGLLNEKIPYLTRRPFRAPHHTATASALAGGGRYPKPGEITLAHKGVLFMDELPEFSRKALEILRQPLEEKKICISRTTGSYTFPAECLLVAAMNPCLCGYYPDRNLCRCTDWEIARYMGKLSGPLLDRFDLSVQTEHPDFETIIGKKGKVSSEEIRKQAVMVHAIQKERYQKETFSYNGNMTADAVEKYCVTNQAGQKLLKNTYEKMHLSVRAYHKILKTARTIADLAGEEKIREEHICEAVCYRVMDRNHWQRKEE